MRDGVHVLSVNAAVQATQRIWRADQVELVGGGGTDLRVGIEAAERFRPSVVIVLTDGLTPWPQQPPNNSRVVIVDFLGSTGFPE